MFFALSASSTFAQDKLDSELLILSNWTFHSYSSGVPFISSDTVVLFRCGYAYGTSKQECNGLEENKWEIMFDEDDENMTNILIVFDPNLPKTYMHSDVLIWKLKGKKNTITGEGVTVKYKVIEYDANQYLLLKSP